MAKGQGYSKRSKVTHTSRMKTGSFEDSDEKALSDAELSFGCFNMSRNDFHSIRNFLQNALGGGWMAWKRNVAMNTPSSSENQLLHVDLQPLTELVVDVLGEYVGTTAKDQETDDPLAFITLLPLFSSELTGIEGITETHNNCLASLRNVLLWTAQHNGGELTFKQFKQLKECLTNKRVALIFHERFINLPVEVAAPLYQQLIDDLPAAMEESLGFNPEYVLLSVPIYKEVESSYNRNTFESTRTENDSNQIPEEQEQVDDMAFTEDYQFYYGEDELLPDLCDLWWDLRVKTSHENPDSRRVFSERGVEVARRSFLLTKENFELFVEQVQQFLPL